MGSFVEQCCSVFVSLHIRAPDLSLCRDKKTDCFVTNFDAQDVSAIEERWFDNSIHRFDIVLELLDRVQPIQSKGRFLRKTFISRKAPSSSRTPASSPVSK